MNISLRDFLRTRRSVRRFKPDPVPDSVLRDILHTATFAPSAHNHQPWRFAVIKNVPSRGRLAAALTAAMRADMTAEGAASEEIEARAARSAKRLNEAPVVILLCRDKTAVREHKPQDEIMSIQSVAAAATYLLLAAHAEGLGSSWICWPLYAQEATQQALNLPETWQPQAMVFLGYADQEPREKKLNPPEGVVVEV